MGGLQMPTGWDEFLDRIRSRIDIAAVAERLGMRLERPGSDIPLALCPFHDDRSPSLHLYRNRGSSNGFYCFVCCSHGDAFDLVAKHKGLQFRDAVKWLAEFLGEPMPQSPTDPVEAKGVTPRNLGLQRGLQIFRNQSASEKLDLAAFSQSRSFHQRVLCDLEVYAAHPHKISIYLQRLQDRDESRELETELEAAGLLLGVESGEIQTFLPNQNPRDFFWDERIIFTVRDQWGEIAGFAGRALSQDAKRKYLYSKGFQRQSNLYRLNRVFRHLRAQIEDRRGPNARRTVWIFELYVVEGLLDALRLELLGLQACAVMGSTLTPHQANLLSDLSAEVSRNGGILAIHLFLDFDVPGRAGGAKSVLTLWETLLKSEAAATVDFVAGPLPISAAKDPDELLRDSEAQDAQDLLRSSLKPAIQLILADILECSPLEVDSAWESKPPLVQRWALKILEVRLTRKKWAKVFSIFRPLATAFHAEQDPPLSWHRILKSFLAIESTSSKETINDRDVVGETLPGMAGNPKAEQRLQFAHHLGMASRHRREFPIDGGSWIRLGIGFDAITPFYKEILASGKAQRLEPYLAVLLPKASGATRLKALPCPEDLTLQHYVLSELLRTYSENPTLSDYIPAVRWWKGQHQTTGWYDEESDEIVTQPAAVSFAYQVDMEVLDGLIPPGQRSLFRPFFDCWKDFLRYLDDGIALLDCDKYYSLSLDIRSFYDCLPRVVVQNALAKPLELALGRYGFDPFSMAPLLGAATTLPNQHTRGIDRARLIVDWLCEHSFDYPYVDPTTAEVKRTPHNDIGLPQGPDLSAYLANISLFRLDKRVSEAIVRMTGLDEAEKGIPAAVYARYVDDMVLIARRRENLIELRSLIEYELRRIGLSLSTKTEDIPAKSREDIRRWLADKRGLGTDYGPSVGIDPSLILESPDWDDSSINLDRGTALLLLHGQSAGDLVSRPEQILASVRKAREAELRPRDEAVAAKILWLSFLKKMEASGHEAEPDEAAGLFVSNWRDSDLPKASELPQSPEDEEKKRLNDNWPVLAWLEGLYLALNTRLDRNPLADSHEQGVLSDRRRTLARLIERGICNSILRAGLGATEGLDHQKAVWCRVLLSAASEILNDDRTEYPFDLPEFDQGINSSPIIFRHACTLHSAYPSSKALQHLRPRPTVGTPEKVGFAPLLLFHEAVARLSAPTDKSSSTESPVDVLYPILQDVQKMFSLEKARTHNVGALAAILRAWIPAEPTAPVVALKSDLAISAVKSFVNVAGRRTPQLLASRPSMRMGLIDHHRLPRETEFLPVPPAAQYPGILAIKANQIFCFMLNATDPVQAEDGFKATIFKVHRFAPRGLEWKLHDTPGVAHWALFEADLGNWELVSPENDTLTQRSNAEKIEILKKVSGALRSLWSQEHTSSIESDVEWASVPTQYHILRRRNSDSDVKNEAWSILGFQVPEIEISGQAFVAQRHSRSLVVEPIPVELSKLWRLGVALSDLFGALDRSISDPNARLSAKSLALDADQDLAIEGFARSTLSRLRGPRNWLPHFARRSSNDLPSFIETAHQRIEPFARALESDDHRRLLSLAIAIFLEDRLLTNAAEMLTARDEAKGCAEFLVRSVRNLLGTDSKLDAALPVIDKLPSWLPVRRPALAYFALAERLNALPQDGVEELMPLAVCGYRLLGLKELIRAQVLELWYALDPDLRSADCWSFDLTEWGIPDTDLFTWSRAEPSLSVLLTRVARDYNSTDYNRLEQVTTLGWLAALAELAGLTSGKRLRTPARPHEEFAAHLKTFSSILTDRLPPGESITPEAFKNLSDNFRSIWKLTIDVLESLRNLDKLWGLETRTETSHLLHCSSSTGPTREIRSHTLGLRDVPTWIIRTLSVDDRADSWEVAPGGSGDQKILRRATLTTIGREKLVGASWISQGMAKLAGLYFNPLREGDTDSDSTANKRPIKVFVSYSYKDKARRDRLSSHIKHLERENLLEVQYGESIGPGVTWNEEIRSWLRSAEIILLLVSANFMASNYIWEEELPPAIERQKAGEVFLIPILLSPCDWRTSPFGNLNPLPKPPAGPISTLRNKEQAYSAISEALRELAAKLV
jgi:DNA primase catalytic core